MVNEISLRIYSLGFIPELIKRFDLFTIIIIIIIIIILNSTTKLSSLRQSVLIMTFDTRICPSVRAQQLYLTWTMPTYVYGAQLKPIILLSKL